MGDYWRVGVLLDTTQTRTFSQDEKDRYEADEQRRVFRHFRAGDEGRGRKLVAVFENAEDAKQAVDDHNAMELSRASH